MSHEETFLLQIVKSIVNGPAIQTQGNISSTKLDLGFVGDHMPAPGRNNSTSQPVPVLQVLNVSHRFLRLEFNLFSLTEKLYT